MEVSVDWLLVSLIHWQLLTIPLGDMVSDINMVSSDKLLKTVHKFKFLTIGSNTETHGKSKELIFNTRFISEVKSEKPSIIKEIKDLIGKKLKLS